MTAANITGLTSAQIGALFDAQVAAIGTAALAKLTAVQTQGAHEEGVVAKVLFWLEVIFAQTQQGQVAFDDVAVGIARANRESRIYHGIEIDLLNSSWRLSA